MGIFGPTQPYLAQAVGVPSQQINLIWTVRALGSCCATLLTGFIFKQFVRQRAHKLGFLAVCVLLTGIFISVVPWGDTFPLLLSAILLAGTACSQQDQVVWTWTADTVDCRNWQY